MVILELLFDKVRVKPWPRAIAHTRDAPRT